MAKVDPNRIQIILDYITPEIFNNISTGGVKQDVMERGNILFTSYQNGSNGFDTNSELSLSANKFYNLENKTFTINPIDPVLNKQLYLPIVDDKIVGDEFEDITSKETKFYEKNQETLKFLNKSFLLGQEIAGKTKGNYIERRNTYTETIHLIFISDNKIYESTDFKTMAEDSFRSNTDRYISNIKMK